MIEVYKNYYQVSVPSHVLSSASIKLLSLSGLIGEYSCRKNKMKKEIERDVLDEDRITLSKVLNIIHEYEDMAGSIIRESMDKIFIENLIRNEIQYE
jgi:hypothetical protein